LEHAVGSPDEDADLEDEEFEDAVDEAAFEQELSPDLRNVWTGGRRWAAQGEFIEAADPELARVLNAGPLTSHRIQAAVALFDACCQRASAAQHAKSLEGTHVYLLAGPIADYYAVNGKASHAVEALDQAYSATAYFSGYHDALKFRRERANTGDLDAACAIVDVAPPKGRPTFDGHRRLAWTIGLAVEDDSEKRVTLAVGATANSDFPRVLEVLGPTRAGLPVATRSHSALTYSGRTRLKCSAKEPRRQPNSASPAPPTGSMPSCWRTCWPRTPG
jgi:hypothetical protein